MDQSHSWPKGKIKSNVGGLLRSRRAYAGGFVIKDVPRGLYLGRLDPSLAPSTLTARTPSGRGAVVATRGTRTFSVIDELNSALCVCV